ncbi:UNVERIFIED_CONTAM: hypothetical protein GTU68_002315 [Idotea baltica]|nr:hypothetical protein [Idotea baltica]
MVTLSIFIIVIHSKVVTPIYPKLKSKKVMWSEKDIPSLLWVKQVGLLVRIYI